MSSSQPTQVGAKNHRAFTRTGRVVESMRRASPLMRGEAKSSETCEPGTEMVSKAPHSLRQPWINRRWWIFRLVVKTRSSVALRASPKWRNEIFTGWCDNATRTTFEASTMSRCFMERSGDLENSVFIGKTGEGFEGMAQLWSKVPHSVPKPHGAR